MIRGKMMSDFKLKARVAFNNHNIQLSTDFVKRFNPDFCKNFKIFLR